VPGEEWALLAGSTGEGVIVTGETAAYCAKIVDQGCNTAVIETKKKN